MSKNPEDLQLFHYGIKGMKWGVTRTDAQIAKAKQPSARKARYNDIRNRELKTLEVTAKNGKKVSVSEEPTGKISAFLSSLSKTGVQEAKDTPSFKFEVDGKHVGEASFSKVSSNEINLVWLGINKEERGQGYGSSVFDAAVEYGKSEGVSKLTLEVPGHSPDARHIYEKQGFTVTKEPTAKEKKEDTVWGGLTHMELDLTKDRIKHAALSGDDELEKALLETFPQLTEEQEAEVFDPNDVEHGDITKDTIMPESSKDFELFHYGVKGMKWGRRRPVGSDGLVKGGVKKAASKLADAKVASNQRTINMRKGMRDRSGNKLMKTLSAPDRMVMGKKRFEKFHDKTINALEAQNDRIKSGKTTVRDKLDIALNTPLIELVLEKS